MMSIKKIFIQYNCEKTLEMYFFVILSFLSFGIKHILNKQNFGIKHFAGDVDYSTTSFVDKNKNNVNKELKEIFSKTKNSTIRFIFENVSENDSKSKSVSSIFKQQLHSLIQNLNKSLSLYVRCIKPNTIRSHCHFDSEDICRQLRCSGILEAVKVR